MEFTCTECEKDFEAEERLFGVEDIKCSHCNIWLKTDAEEDLDGSYFWIVGKSKDQKEK